MKIGVSSAIDSDVAAPESPESRDGAAGRGGTPVGGSPTGSISYGAEGDWTGVLAVVRTWLQMIAATTATLIAAAAYQSTCSIDTAPRSVRASAGSRLPAAGSAARIVPYTACQIATKVPAKDEGRIGHGGPSRLLVGFDGTWVVRS